MRRQLPHMGCGRGVRRVTTELELPGAYSWEGSLRDRREWLVRWMGRLRDRIADVRVCSGDWTRVVGKAVTTVQGLTAVFLDPPYSAEERVDVYACETDVSRAVREWALQNSSNPLFRIALCGYDTEHDSAMPADWERWRWKGHGGWGRRSPDGRGNANRLRETIWFSPHCLKSGMDLFSEDAGQ